MININEFRKKSKEDLKEELIKLEKEYRKVVSDILQRKEKNVMKSGMIKRDIARVKTLLNEVKDSVDEEIKEKKIKVKEKEVKKVAKEEKEVTKEKSDDKVKNLKKDKKIK